MKTLNNNIQESYCSFEVSKVLKEKGFNNATSAFYWLDDEPNPELVIGRTPNQEFHKGYGNSLSAPTHALAIEWIKQNYGSDKIKHITYDWTSNQIDNELILILQKCGNQ